MRGTAWRGPCREGVQLWVPSASPPRPLAGRAGTWAESCATPVLAPSPRKPVLSSLPQWGGGRKLSPALAAPLGGAYLLSKVCLGVRSGPQSLSSLRAEVFGPLPRVDPRERLRIHGRQRALCGAWVQVRARDQGGARTEGQPVEGGPPAGAPHVPQALGRGGRPDAVSLGKLVRTGPLTCHV